MAVNRCSPATLSLVRPCEETMAERTVLRRPEPLPTLPGPSSAVRDHPRLRAGKKAAPVKLTDCVAGTETQALPPAAPIPPASGAAVRPRSPARPGQLGRRHCLLFHPATRRGGPRAPGGPGLGRMEADVSEELAKRAYHGCAGYGKRTAFFRCSEKKRGGRLRAPTAEPRPGHPVAARGDPLLPPAGGRSEVRRFGTAAEKGRSPPSAALTPPPRRPLPSGMLEVARRAGRTPCLPAGCKVHAGHLSERLREERGPYRSSGYLKLMQSCYFERALRPPSCPLGSLCPGTHCSRIPDLRA